MLQPTSITFLFDHFSFETEDVEELRSAFGELGPTRGRVAYIERGGDETTLWIVASFVGLAFVGGIIEHIAGNSFDALLSKLRLFYAKRRQQDPKYAQAVAFRLSFDDLDVEVNLPGETRAEFMEPLLRRIHEHLIVGPLRDSSVTTVKVPFSWNDGEQKWLQTFVWSESEFVDRYWGISCHGMPIVSSIYDSLDRKTVTTDWELIHE
jgi:hypothetical protein